VWQAAWQPAVQAFVAISVIHDTGIPNDWIAVANPVMTPLQAAAHLGPITAHATATISDPIAFMIAPAFGISFLTSATAFLASLATVLAALTTGLATALAACETVFPTLLTKPPRLKTLLLLLPSFGQCRVPRILLTIIAVSLCCSFSTILRAPTFLAPEITADGTTIFSAQAIS